MEYCKKCTYILLDKCSTQESVKNWATENGSQWIGWKRGLMETIMSFIFFHLSSSFFHFSSFSFNFISILIIFFHFKTCPHFLRTVCIPTFVFIFMCYIHFNTKLMNLEALYFLDWSKCWPIWLCHQTRPPPSIEIRLSPTQLTVDRPH